MQAFGDIRVSTDKQTREGVSLAAQEARLRAYCSAVEERDGRL
jgi:DNA invertase Pin-like site-specific DNA recombinase